jgi:hypothetical protein
MDKLFILFLHHFLAYFWLREEMVMVSIVGISCCLFVEMIYLDSSENVEILKIYTPYT